MTMPTAPPVALYYDVLQYQPENLELLRRHFALIMSPDPDHDADDVLAAIEVVFAPLGYHWDADRIARAPRLKVIGSNTTGTPHIDVEYAERRGIRVVSLHDQHEFLAGITPTAELTWGLLLGVVRRIPWAFESVCSGTWNRRLFGGSAMLSRMTLGVVGLGRLGTLVARQGVTFGMRVRYFDRRRSAPPELKIERAGSLEELVAASDVVTIHLPFDATTRGLFDARLIAKFRRGSYLINTSRGEIVDSAALLAALERGGLAGAGLDVLAGEFERGFADGVSDSPLVAYARKHDNLLITPHIGGSTLDAWRLTEEQTIRRVLEVLGR